jgi:hypothetical protein
MQHSSMGDDYAGRLFPLGGFLRANIHNPHNLKCTDPQFLRDSIGAIGHMGIRSGSRRM